LGVDPFIPPDKTRHGTVLPPAPRGRIPRHLSPSERMRRKLRTKRGRKRYALRMETVEPVFGQIKESRGFRQFLLRGLEKVKREWRLICTGHNLLKLFASLQKSPIKGGIRRLPEGSARSAAHPRESWYRSNLGHNNINQPFRRPPSCCQPQSGNTQTGS